MASTRPLHFQGRIRQCPIKTCAVRRKVDDVPRGSPTLLSSAFTHPHVEAEAISSMLTVYLAPQWCRSRAVDAPANCETGPPGHDVAAPLPPAP
jgi:hypothetical protein